MPVRMRLRAWMLAACVGVVVTPPRAGRAEESSAANIASARRHFEKARAYYGQGAYREAITELEAAHALDPNAKDLVFNLGVVHEKLADIDEALKWFRLYTTMDLVPQERERADAYIRRLEGAKKELEERQAAAQAAQGTPGPKGPPAPPEPTTTAGSPTTPPPTPPPTGTAEARPSPRPPPSPVAPPPPLAPRPYGRVDGWTIATAGVATGALAFAIIMGIKAVQDHPTGDFVSGETISGPDLVRDLQNRADTAHHEAAWADVGFGVALVSGVGAAYLYFARPRGTARSTVMPTVSPSPLSGGGALLLHGRF